MSKTKNNISDIRDMLEFIENHLDEGTEDCFDETIKKVWIILEDATGFNEIGVTNAREELYIVTRDTINEGKTNFEKNIIAYAINSLLVKEGIYDVSILESTGQLPDMLETESVVDSMFDNVSDDTTIEEYTKITRLIKQINRETLISKFDRNIVELL
jgi:hypothetical protein